MDLTLPPSLTRLFVTEIYRADMSKAPKFKTFLETLDDTCRAIADEDEAGQDWSQKHGYLGYTSYASIKDLSPYAPVFGELKAWLDIQVSTFAAQIDLEPVNGQKLKLIDMWINILEHLGHHAGHIHPHSVVSGTFYVAVPPGSSAIRFEDPRLDRMMHAPLRKPTARADRQTFHSVAPAPGTVLLWESWLRHEVPINLAEDVRISISFNYA